MPKPSQLTLLFLVTLSASCGPKEEDARPAEPATAQGPKAEAPDPRLPIYAAADRRELAPAVLHALGSNDPLLRLAAVEALGRLRDPAHLERLRAALRHPDARVRLSASFGISLLDEVPARPADAQTSPEEALLGAVAAAMADPGPDRAAEIAGHTRDLGRIGAGAALPALRAALDHGSAEVRLAATDALSSFGRRQVPVSDDLHGALLEAARTDDAGTVRAGAARALAALAPPVPAAIREEVRLGLLEALESAGPEVAPLLARALVPYGPVPAMDAARIAGSADPVTAYEGFRLLVAGGRDAEPALAAALLALAGRAASGSREERILLGDALTVAFPLARAEATHRAAQRILERLGDLSGATLPDGLAHCAASELVDRGKGWPARTPGCGLGVVPPHLGARRAAAILRDVPGEDALRASFLGRLYRAGPDPVRAAVLDALVGLPLEPGRALLAQGLGSRDVAVVAAALRAVLHHRGALLASQSGPALHGPLEAARATLARVDDAPGLALYVEAAAAIGDRRSAAAVRELSASPHRAIREVAVRALAAGFPGTEPSPTFPPPPNAITADELAGRPGATTYRVRTTIGTFDVELEPGAAPVTTRRFQELVSRGFYEGLAFHGRSPGFVVQGGDPRGDGHGGGGQTIRDEPSPSRFERGTVGLALAGPDTGASQFFVTLFDQPQLEGRYTAFARVVAGMEVVDRIVPGEKIERIEPVPDDGAPQSNRRP